MAQGRKRSRTGQTHRKTPKDLRDWDILANPSGDPVQPKQRRKPKRRKAAEPVPIEKIDPDRGIVLPRTGRTAGWSRNNNDALPRARRDT